MHEYKKLIGIGVWSVGAMHNTLVMRHGDNYCLSDKAKEGCGWWMWMPNEGYTCPGCAAHIPDEVQAVYILYSGDMIKCRGGVYT